MKRTLKIVIVSILLLALTACALLVFAACNEKNTGGKNTGEDKGNFISDYASAKTAWDAAPNKMSVDSGSITATLGTGEKPVEVTANLEGKRVYIGDTFRMEYTVTVFLAADLQSAASDDDQMGQAIADALIDAISDEGLALTLSLEKDADGIYTLNATAADMYELAEDVRFTDAELHDTIPVLDFGMNCFYDAEHIDGSAGEYTIPGATALDWILWQVAPILAYDAGYDIMPMIYDWIDFGDITGNVTFSAGNFAAMITSQDITAFMPREDADFLIYNVEFFPMMLKTLIEQKTLIIADLIKLDLSEALADDGIGLSGTVSTSAKYSVLPADASFSGVF